MTVPLMERFYKMEGLLSLRVMTVHPKGWTNYLVIYDDTINKNPRKEFVGNDNVYFLSMAIIKQCGLRYKIRKMKNIDVKKAYYASANYKKQPDTQKIKSYLGKPAKVYHKKPKGVVSVNSRKHEAIKYDSVKQCESLGYSSDAIYKAIRKELKYKGCYWIQYSDFDEEDFKAGGLGLGWQV